MARRVAESLVPDYNRGGESVDFDPEEFDRQIEAHGVNFTHWRAMGCPEGMVNRDDAIRHSHHDHHGCSNGFLYRVAGCLPGIFSGNSSRDQFMDMGSVDGSTAQVTFRRAYDAGSMAYFAYADRLYLSDASVLWPHWEHVEHNLSGKDRLRFPPVQVQDLVDNRMVSYQQGIDFNVLGGQIVWIPGRAPGADLETGDPVNGDNTRGRVYTVRYLYQPFWYVQTIGKAIRVMEVHDPDGNPRTVRLPFQATLVRETTFEDRERNDDATSRETGRDQTSARDGSFGPR